MAARLLAIFSALALHQREFRSRALLKLLAFKENNMLTQTVGLNYRIFLAATIAVAGCSGQSGLAPVSGKVTYKGQPVSGATVLFMGNENTRPATAVSGSDGSYSLMTLDAKGAMPGNYAVVVTKTDAPPAGEPPSMEDAAKAANRPPPPPKELLPAKYSDATKSPLKVEVKLGQSNTIDLTLAD
jgi:hypothetical protein